MKHTYLYIIICATLLSLTGIYASETGNGRWRTHFSYHQTDDIFVTPSKIYGLSNGNMYSYDKSSGDIETYSKITGLSDGAINIAMYNEETNSIIICYENLNIDVMEDGNITNISDLKRKEISGKSLNSIAFNGKYAYLSCGFGIVVINLEKKEISDTYIIGANGEMQAVSSTAIANDSIYALTGGSIIAANLNSNLSNYLNWNKLTITSNANFSGLTTYNNSLIAIRDTSVFEKIGNNWKKLTDRTTNFKLGNGFLTLYNNDSVKIFNEDMSLIEAEGINTFGAIYDPNSKSIWAATDGGLSNFKNGTLHSKVVAKGPRLPQFYFAKFRNGRFITGYGEGYSTNGIIQIYNEDGTWTFISGANINEEYSDMFKTVLDAEIDPTDNKRMYVATWRSLFEFYDDKFVKRYDTNESSLLNCVNVSNKNVILTDGLAFDEQNNLWMLNMQAGELIHVKGADGNWYSTDYNKSQLNNTATARATFVSSNGLKWILIPRVGSGIFVIDDKKTPTNFTDDATRFFSSFTERSSTESKTVTPSTYRCITEDKNNDIWVGTDIGPIIFRNTENIMKSNYSIDRIKITRDDNAAYADYLLGTEQVNTIAVDGANRKWIGTASSGVYLLSEDGKETIEHFTTDNSPLTSNTVMSISINPDNGEVFIVCSDNLFSYKSDASEGKEDYDNVYVYPNPVRPEHSGIVTISGLMAESEVRITTLSGKVIIHGLSNGGTFSWDGKTAAGSKVAPGIYLVFAVTRDGSEKMVSKIAFLK